MAFTALVAIAATVAPARSASAQDQATIDKLVQLNKKGMDDYDTADFDTAKKALLDAEKLGKRAGLEGHPVMARTYIHLGALYLIGFKDKQKAQHYFGKALGIQADIKLDKNLTSAAVRDLFASVKAQKGDAGSAAEDLFPPAAGQNGGGAKNDTRNGGKKGRPPAAVEPAVDAEPEGDADAASQRRGSRRDGASGGEPDLPTTITALDCPYPDDTPPGKKVTLRCVAAANLGVAKVVLFYKGFEMTDYEEAAMNKSPKGWWQATVPKKRVDGKSLQFYFEGLDASDKPVVSNGRAESPNVMLIVERAAKVAGAGGTSSEDENPLEQENRTTPRLVLGTRDDSRLGVDTRYGNRRFWIGLGLGTGVVYAMNGVPEARVCGLQPAPGHSCMSERPDTVVSGIGWAGLGHLVPEIGVHINPDWAISIESRHQWIPQSKKAANYTASGAHAALLKIIRYTKQQQFRMFFALAGGGGEGVRMNILADPANPDFKDTLLIGGILLGGSVGISYEISRQLTWIAEINALLGFPKKGGVGDFNTALQVNFGDTSGAAEAAKAKRANSVSGSIDDEDPQ
ncbi:MAG: tetratricopeptide repeat protein [Pseudomonadota bacterium]